jgi:membrane-bound serine protease (ClpP class)
MVCLCLLLSAAFLALVHIAPAQTPATDGGDVYVVPISGTIDLGLAPYLSRVLTEAEANGAAAVLLDIDTPGGRLDAVLQMRDALLGSSVRTIAFVDRTAFSAGALIAIAADEIYMAPGAVMGAATPVDGATGEAADEKVISAVRTTFRATAEARDRNPVVAEAMVDPNVSIEGLVTRGQLLTMTTNEADTWGYADGIASTNAQVLDQAGLGAVRLIETEPSLAERVVRFITDPAVATLLITFGILLLIGDFFVEGFGLAGAAGIALLALFFWGHSLAGLTGWEDIALVVLGLILIAVEILVIPGFGIAGLLGLAALLGGFFLAMLGRDIQTPEGIERSATTILVAFVATAVGLVAGVVFLTRGSRSRQLRRLVLDSTVTASSAPAARPALAGLDLFGASARLPREQREDTSAQVVKHQRASGAREDVALSDLRPSGIARIGGMRVDVVTAGEHIAAGSPIEVVRDEGYRLIVRQITR